MLIMLCPSAETCEDVANPWAVETSELSHEAEMADISSTLAAALSVSSRSSSTLQHNIPSSGASSRTVSGFASPCPASDSMDHDEPGLASDQAGSGCQFQNGGHAGCQPLPPQHLDQGYGEQQSNATANQPARQSAKVIGSSERKHEIHVDQACTL